MVKKAVSSSRLKTGRGEGSEGREGDGGHRPHLLTVWRQDYIRKECGMVGIWFQLLWKVDFAPDPWVFLPSDSDFHISIQGLNTFRGFWEIIFLTSISDASDAELCNLTVLRILLRAPLVDVLGGRHHAI